MSDIPAWLAEEWGIQVCTTPYWLITLGHILFGLALIVVVVFIVSELEERR